MNLLAGLLQICSSATALTPPGRRRGDGCGVAGRRTGLGDGQVAAFKAGWDFPRSGVQINRFCASGLEAVNMAAQKVRSGWEDLVVAGAWRA